MKRFAIIFLCLCVFGCYEKTDGWAQGDEYNYILEFLQILSESTPHSETSEEIIIFLHSNRFGYPIASTEDWDRWFLEVQECLSLSAEPMFIFIMDEIEEDTRGRTTHEGTSAFIRIKSQFAAFPGTPKHEFVHYILATNGMDSDRDHKNPAYWACAP